MNNSFWGKWYIAKLLPFLVGFLILFPLCMVRDMSKFRVFSMFGVITLVTITLLIIIESPFFIRYYWKNTYKKQDFSTHLNLFNLTTGFNKELYFFQFCGSLYYPYITTIAAIPIFRTMKKNTLEKMKRVVKNTLIFEMVLFSIIGIVGYFTWPIKTPDLILEREKIYSGADIPMSIGRLALIITIIFKLPNVYNALRLTIHGLTWKTETISAKENIIITSVTILISCIIAVIYSEICGYIKLIGGICCSIAGFIIPALLYVKSNDLPRWHWKNIASIFCYSALSTFGLISAEKTIYDMFTK